MKASVGIFGMIFGNFRAMICSGCTGLEIQRLDLPREHECLRDECIGTWKWIPLSWMLGKDSSLRQSKKSACFMEESIVGVCERGLSSAIHSSF